MAGCGNGNTAITRLCASAPRRRPGGLAMEQLHNRVKAQETDPEVAAQEITGGKNLTLYEVDEATTRIREVDADANIIVGATFDVSPHARRKIVPRCRRRHPGGRKYCSARKRASNS
jgi:cell division GTPase FtsZ